MMSKLISRPLSIGVVVIVIVTYLTTPNGEGHRVIKGDVALAQARPTFPPDRPTFPTPRADEREPDTTDICLRLTAEPNTLAKPAGTIIYRLVARNSGRGRATNLQARVPFVPETQTLLDATFTKSDAWVSAILTDTIEIKVESLDRDETLTATLRLRTAPNAQTGSSIPVQSQVVWDGQQNIASSNRVSLLIADVDGSNLTVPLKIAPPIGDVTTNFTVAYDGFASNERLSIWYHSPDGHVVALDETWADGQGKIKINLPATNLLSGRYMLVVYGQCSGVSAIGTLTVT